MGNLESRNKNNFQYNEEIKQQIPRSMMVEVTNFCNHSCIFCENRKSVRKRKFIEKDLLEDILKQAYKLGVREVGFYTTGEPLLHKELPEFIRIAKQLGFEYVYITTNGALMTENVMRNIVEAGIDSIKFSINAGTNETYELIHGVADFEKALQHLRRLNEFRKEIKADFKIYISYVRTKQNVNEVDLLKSMVNEIVDDFMICDAYNTGGNMYEINDFLMLEGAENFQKVPCSMVFNRIHITVEGYLNVCCVDFQNYLAVADLKKMTLDEAWNCDKIKEIRKKHIEKNLEGTLCYNCVYNKCGQVSPLIDELSTFKKTCVEQDLLYIEKRLKSKFTKEEF